MCTGDPCTCTCTHIAHVSVYIQFDSALCIHYISLRLCTLCPQELLVQKSSVKRLEERIQSASAEKNRLEGELMTLQSELKSGKKTQKTLESENAKLNGTFVPEALPSLSVICVLGFPVH